MSDSADPATPAEELRSQRRQALVAVWAEQRDFLLHSIDDLEAEHEAGDLDLDDYRSLKADYTKRAADVIRKIESEDAPKPDPASARRDGWQRVVMWMVLVFAVAGLAGVLVARASGSRSPGGSITGDIRVSTRQLLFEAQQAFGGGDLPRAIEIYDEVLDTQPSNVEALTYKGWLTRLQGDSDAARLLLDDAVAIDPEYPDARVFSAVVALDLDEPAAADAHLVIFDSLEASPFMGQIVESMGLRERIDLALQGDSGNELLERQQAALDKVEPLLLIDRPPTFSETGLTVTEVVDAAEALAASGQLIEAVKLVDMVISEFPDNVEALTASGWLIVRTQNAELVVAGISDLDKALEIEPNSPTALVYRSFARWFSGDLDGARIDLAAFDSLDEKPVDLVALIGQSGLREELG